MGRSSLCALLGNRAYIGETIHKGASYKGEHKVIVPRALFDAVQKQLTELGPALSGKARTAQDAAYANLVFDDTGAPMLPTYSVKKGNLRYCYYVSRPRLKGDASKASITRIPGPQFEGFILDVLTRLGLGAEPRAAVRRIDILAQSVRIQLDNAAAIEQWRSEDRGQRDKGIIQQVRQYLLPGETLAESAGRFDLVLPVRAKFRGGISAIIHPVGTDQTALSPDIALIKALARAHRWREMLINGADSIESIARRFRLDRGHAGLTLKLAFLSPKITRSILQGEQPPGLRLKDLLDADIPLSWRDQDEAFARLCETARLSLLQPYRGRV